MDTTNGDDNGPDTKKISGLPQGNERENAQYIYDKALKRMITEKSQESIDAFLEANKKLFYIIDAYRIGERLKKEHEFQKGTISQELHLL